LLFGGVRHQLCADVTTGAQEVIFSAFFVGSFGTGPQKVFDSDESAFQFVDIPPSRVRLLPPKHDDESSVRLQAGMGDSADLAACLFAKVVVQFIRTKSETSDGSLYGLSVLDNRGGRSFDDTRCPLVDSQPRLMAALAMTKVTAPNAPPVTL
jgi:hypothetical protein